MSDRNSTEQLSSSLPSLSAASSHSSPFIATLSNFNREKVELKQNSPLQTKKSLLGAARDSQHEQIASEEHFKEQSRLAQAGDPVAWFNVGVCYAMGYGVEKNGAAAISCFQKAAEQGHVEALYGLAICYVTGCGLVAKDAIAAASWLKKAAEKEYVAAQFHLGAWYESGYGVIKNEAAALRWYKRAAANGDLDAQTNAGVCYLKGEGAEKDEAVAVSCFRKAAKKGHAGAQNNLGVCYEKGLGVWKSEGAMRYWYERAAIQGNASAQANLARIRRNNVAPAAFVPPHSVLDSFSHSSPEGFSSSSAFQMVTRTPVNTSPPPDRLERLSPRVETTGQMAEGKPIPSKSQTSWALHAGPFEGNLALSEELALSKALFHALKRQDINAVKSLLAKGAPLNVKNSKEDTPLLVAVKKGYLAAVDALLNAEEGSASVDQADKSGQTPLVMAVMAGRLDIGAALLERGADYQHSRQWLISHGEKHLSEAEHKKAQEAITNLDMLYRQVDKGVRARAQSAKEFTERFFLSGLQEKAADEQTTSSSFQTTTHTPVAIPSRRDTREQLSLTLETKGQADAKRLPDKNLAHWALHAGALEGNLVLSEELASSKALFHALKRQDINAVKSLVAKGAPLNVKNSKEDTPLQIAVRKGFLEAVDIFLGAEKSSALVDQADKSGQTPLVMAVMAGHLDIGAALLRRGADYQNSRQWLISHLLGKGLPEREHTKAHEALANLDVLHCQVGKGVQVAEEQPAKEFTDGFLISALQEKVAGGQMATSERTTVDTIVAQFWRDAGVGGNEKELLKFSEQYQSIPIQDEPETKARLRH